MSIKRMAGTTLIELIVAIVIVSTALAGLVAAYNRANTASADPLITQQQLAIAESMMEEVMQKPFAAQANQAGRVFFNDVMDYNNYGPAAVTNVNGDAVPGLGRYTVQVLVNQPAITGVAAADALRIQVIVRAAGAENLRLVGWRTRP
jgi:MSHA pilin protein MshD